MKISREGLKALIRECLIEVLEEGLGHTQPLTEQRRPRPMQPRLPSAPSARPARPAVAAAVARSSAVRPPPLPKPQRPAGPVDLLDTIFEDTAQTTLVEQARFGHVSPSHAGDEASGAADIYSRAIADKLPDEVFGGETAGNWSKLAFNRPVLDRGISPEPPAHLGPPPASSEGRRSEQSSRGVAQPLDFDPYNPDV